MSSSRPYIRLALAIACVVVSVAGLVNVFGDNDDVLKLAKEAGCGGAPCDIARIDRSPWAQTFDFRARSGLVTVRCARSSILFGDYACEKK